MANTSIRIIPLPAFNDNYIWLMTLRGLAWAVDPGDAAVVERYLSSQSLSLAGILLTHHHADHTGGAYALQSHWQCPVYAPESTHPAYEALHCQRLSDGERMALLPEALTAVVMTLPGHTLDHIAYVINQQHLFCGDVLFGGGCGRLFEGSASQMFASLQRIMQLPPETLIYPAHEYTAHNLAFAKGIEPDNLALKARITDTQRLRALQQPTLPSTVALELATNPFLRCDSLLHTDFASLGSALAVFTALREQRNHF